MTNVNLTGETESSLPSLEKLTKWLEDFLSHHGLATPKLNKEYEKYLNMSEEILRKLSPEDAANGAATLRQFSYYIQRVYNDKLSKLNWLQNNLNRFVCSRSSEYNGASFEERKQKVIMDNEHALKMEELRSHYQAACNNLEYVGARADGLASALIALQQAKMKRI